MKISPDDRKQFELLLSGGKTDNRSRKERRKETGEDFTPPALVNEILDHFPPEVWTNDQETWFDPACGNGNFLVAVKERLMVGLKDKIPDDIAREKYILENLIFGIDIMRDNVIETCQRLGVLYNPRARDIAVSRNILCANTLEHATQEKMKKLFQRADRAFSKFEKRQRII